MFPLRAFNLGDRIQHVSGAGPIFEIIRVREDDAVAVTNEPDPQITRIINPDNWTRVGKKDHEIWHIKKADLEHGVYYFGKCRNAKLARWDADRQYFVHWRTKFADTFLETIHCPEDDAVFDVFYAMEKATNLEIPLDVKVRTDAQDKPST